MLENPGYRLRRQPNTLDYLEYLAPQIIVATLCILDKISITPGTDWRKLLRILQYPEYRNSDSPILIPYYILRIFAIFQADRRRSLNIPNHSYSYSTLPHESLQYFTQMTAARSISHRQSVPETFLGTAEESRLHTKVSGIERECLYMPVHRLERRLRVPDGGTSQPLNP